MRSGTALASVIVAAIVALGVSRSAGLIGPLELVPPIPSFGVEDRTVDTAVVPPPYGEGEPSMRELAEDQGILIGAAVEPDDMALDASYNATVAREFNIITTENALKLGLVRRAPNRYVFGPADVIVDFAEQNDIQVRGHTLVWHEEVPRWLEFVDLEPEQLAAFLKEHIETVVGRYEGRIQYWDVLNEAIDWDGSLRKTIWLEMLGPEYIDLVFHWAHAADPEAKLFYNDFNAEDLGAKSDGVYELVKGMVERGVPIHGVGFQGHFGLDDVPSSSDVAANIERLAALGLEVQFTEVDVRIEEPVTDEDLQRQASIYWSMLDVCVSQPACTAFVTWGVTDKHSWIPVFLDGYDAGLIFDDEYQAKPAYWAMRDVLERRLDLGVSSPD
jgi:endo-1,4-beta-xylanase